jgi:hypothetical protein
MRGRAVGTDWEVYKHDSPSPFAKVQAISAVYFPQFCHFIDDLYETGTSYMVWSHKAEQKTISKDEQFDEGYRRSVQPLLCKAPNNAKRTPGFCSQRVSMTGTNERR